MDWWTLGILIYEMLVGRTPFYCNDVRELYMLILRGRCVAHMCGWRRG